MAYMDTQWDIREFMILPTEPSSYSPVPCSISSWLCFFPLHEIRGSQKGAGMAQRASSPQTPTPPPCHTHKVSGIK